MYKAKVDGGTLCLTGFSLSLAEAKRELIRWNLAASSASFVNPRAASAKSWAAVS